MPKRGAMVQDLMKALGAEKVLVLSVRSPPTNKELDKYDLFISDEPRLARKQLQGRIVRSWDWVKDCIVTGRIVPYDV